MSNSRRRELAGFDGCSSRHHPAAGTCAACPCHISLTLPLAPPAPISCRLVPDGSHHYYGVWTGVFTLAACFTWAFMAGSYGVYQLQASGGATAAGAAGSAAWGPASMWTWLKFWVQDPA